MSWFSSVPHHVGHIIYSRTLSVHSVTVFSDELVLVCFYHASMQLLLHPLFGRPPPSTTEPKSGEMSFIDFLFLCKPGWRIHTHTHRDTEINLWFKTILTFSWIPWRWTPPGHLGPGSYQSVSVLSDKCGSGPLHLWGHLSRHPLQGSHSGPSSWHVAESCFGDAQSRTCVSVLPGSEEKTTLLDSVLQICTESTKGRWVRS